MAASAERSLTVFAWGNESRGDDAVGPVLARRICGLGNTGIEVIEDHQLHIEHLMDLDPDTPALFIDASIAIDEDFRLERIGAVDDGSLSTHAMSPTALLAFFEKTVGSAAPDAYLLHVKATRFELGEPPSDETVGRIDSAWRFLSGILELPPDRWRDRLAAASVDTVS